MRFAAWYGIVIGVLMIAQWTFFLSAGEVPEVESEPVRLGFHLAAEFTTAVGLIVAGLALLRRRPWGGILYAVAAGMVIYSEIVSPGYFGQKGQWGFVVMFMVLLVLAVLSLTLLARKVRAEGDVER